MTRTHLLLLASAFDLAAGDPEWFPHPVRLMGQAISHGETALRRPGHSPRTAFVLGALLTTAVVTTSYLASKALLSLSRNHSDLLANATELTLAWTTIAARNLYDEASSVLDALDADELTSARQRLSRIVGRDTENLDPQEISRAVVETVAESLSDGVLAPIFYLALGGVPLAFAYKAVNTLDSMIGHADQRYFYFGKFAARLDDIANLIPARFTALALVAASTCIPGCSPAQALATWRSDHGKHKSPNAGHPESAMAGALRVRLGGQNHYAGELIETPYLGKRYSPATSNDARKSLHLAALATVFGIALFSLLQSRRTSRQATRHFSLTGGSLELQTHEESGGSTRLQPHK